MLEKYWATAHAWQFQEAAKMFHLPYLSITDPSSLTRAVREEKTVFIEMHTNREENHTLHNTIEKKIKETIHALAGAVT